MTAHGRGDYVLFGWGLTATLLAAFLFKSGLLLMVGLLLGVVGLATTIWGRYALSRVSYQHTFAQSRIFAGESVGLTVELVNRKVLPVTYLTVEDTVPAELEIQAKRLRFKRIGKGALLLMYNMGWYQKVIRHFVVKPARRGVFTLGPVIIRGGDPFGYLTSTRELPAPSTLIVYPRIVPLGALGFPTRRPFGDLKSTDRLFEDPLRFAGVRSYQPGDPLNRIHWRASAVAGELQVKLLDPSSNPGLCMFFNTWGHDRFWQGVDPDIFEAQAVVASSVASWATEQNIAVGLFANALAEGWSLNLELPPARGAHVLPAVLEGLARLQMPSRTTCAEMILGNLQRLTYGTSVVVITRHLPDDLAAPIMQVQRSGRPVTLVFVGPEPEAPPVLPGVRVYRVTGEEALHATALA